MDRYFACVLYDSCVFVSVDRHFIQLEARHDLLQRSMTPVVGRTN
jgi:hypothetical protein